MHSAQLQLRFNGARVHLKLLVLPGIIQAVLAFQANIMQELQHHGGLCQIPPKKTQWPGNVWQDQIPQREDQETIYESEVYIAIKTTRYW